MTETVWLSTTRPLPMNDFLHRSNASERKRLLIGPGCCRLVWKQLVDPRGRAAVAAAESLADEPPGSTYGTGVVEAVHRAWEESGYSRDGAGAAVAAARLSLILCLSWHRREMWVNNVGDIMLTARDAEDGHTGSWGRYILPDDPGYTPEHPAQANLLRDIFGNPFRPISFDPAWRTSTVESLAMRMYDAREFSLMPIMGDALQDAGCDSVDILDHCRSDALHVRGCWVLDLALGKS